MTADRPEPEPIACALQSGDFQQRLAWIAELNRDALRSRHRDGLRLKLIYAREALDRVRDMVARERDCCAFLTFDLRPEEESVRLVIEAPVQARDMLDIVFEPFLAPATDAASCRCSGSVSDEQGR